MVLRLLAENDATRAELAREKTQVEAVWAQMRFERNVLVAERDAARAALLQMQNANVDLCRQLDDAAAAGRALVAFADFVITTFPASRLTKRADAVKAAAPDRWRTGEERRLSGN